MYPAKFNYVRASSVDDAIAQIQANDEAKLLAGGHSLLPAMKLRLAEPSTLVDIGRIEDLRGISYGGRGDVDCIGPLTTHATIASSNVAEALAEAAGGVGDPQVRNRGTIGGNIAHADPASDLPTVLVALGALISVQGPNGERSIDAADFFVDLFETNLAEDELITLICVPCRSAGTGSAYAKLFNPASRYAMVGAAASVTLSGDTIASASVAVGGLTPTATRGSSVENALQGQTADAIGDASQAILNDIGDDILGDIHASADYRRGVLPTFVQRALSSAVARAG